MWKHRWKCDTVGQLLSVSKDAATFEFPFKRWLKIGCPKPKEAVADYGRAILGAMCFRFNGLTLKVYISKCFVILQNKTTNRPASTFIRVDVAHFMAIVSELKRSNNSNFAVEDFLMRGIALLISCDNFTQFEDILTLLLIVACQEYDGGVETDSISSTRAKNGS